MALLVKFLSVFVASVFVLGQNAFEPANFNTTLALIDNGIDISTLVELPETSALSPLQSCAAAVRCHFIYAHRD